MISSENHPQVVQPSTTTTTTAVKTTAQNLLEEPTPLKCPRCDSSNTKFCYYNNYNKTQPRHFCKTCRRYWTKGGALRNVPIGGGCRKTKKQKPYPSSSSRLLELSVGPGNETEFKFLDPLTITPAVEFQLGGLSLPQLHPATAGVYTQFIVNSGTQNLSPPTGGCFGLDLLGLGNNNYPVPTIPTSGNNSSISPSSSSAATAGGGCGGAGRDQPIITISTFESLSTINQEMHQKLQEQRLAMIYNNDEEKPYANGLGINLFKNFESARNNNNNNNKLELAAGPTPTEWLFEQIPANYGANHNHNHHDYQFNGFQ